MWMGSMNIPVRSFCCTFYLTISPIKLIVSCNPSIQLSQHNLEYGVFKSKGLEFQEAGL